MLCNIVNLTQQLRREIRIVWNLRSCCSVSGNCHLFQRILNPWNAIVSKQLVNESNELQLMVFYHEPKFRINGRYKFLTHQHMQHKKKINNSTLDITMMLMEKRDICWLLVHWLHFYSSSYSSQNSTSTFTRAAMDFNVYIGGSSLFQHLYSRTREQCNPTLFFRQSFPFLKVKRSNFWQKKSNHQNTF